MRKHGALLNDNIFKCTWHSKKVLQLSLKFSTHEVKSSFQYVFQMQMDKKFVYFQNKKICINTVNPWDAEKKRNNSYMQNVDWWLRFSWLGKKEIKKHKVND